MDEKAIKIEIHKRLTRIIIKKISLLERRKNVNSNSEMPITLFELFQYKTGCRSIPMIRLKQIFEFYGCTEVQLAKWNYLMAIMIKNQLKKNST